MSSSLLFKFFKNLNTLIDSEASVPFQSNFKIDEQVDKPKQDSQSSLCLITNKEQANVGQVELEDNSLLEMVKQKMKNLSQSSKKIEAPKEQSSNHNTIKHRIYDEKFRRQFAIKLFNEISEYRGNPKEIIRQSANAIQAQVREVKLWMVAYNIVFRVETAKQGSQVDCMAILKKELVLYLQHNKKEKINRMLKIIGYAMEALQFPNIKLRMWFDSFLEEYAYQLTGVEMSEQMRKSRKPKFIEISDQSEMDQEKKTKHKKSQNRNSNINKQTYETPSNQNGSGFDKKTYQKIDEKILDAVHSIFEKFSQSSGMSYQTIQNLYLRHSKDLLNKISELNENYKKERLTSPPGPAQTPGVEKLAKFQMLGIRLLEFLRSNGNCHVKLLESKTEAVMKELSFPKTWRKQVQQHWFSQFLKSNQLIVTRSRRVKVFPNSAQTCLKAAANFERANGTSLQ